MITTVTLNAAIDKTYFIDEFSKGKVNRVERVAAYPGGKGLNVARVLHDLGLPTIATGIVGGFNGQFIQYQLDKMGVSHDFYMSPSGESRICLNMMDMGNKSSTELLEPGLILSEEELTAIEEKITMLTRKTTMMIFSGSLPDGAPSNFYYSLIRSASRHVSKVFLDTSGPPLTHAIAARPWFIKPNEDEVKVLIGHKPAQETEYVDAARRIAQSGIECVVITLGANGAIASFNGECYRIVSPPIEAVNTVGCGDSFVAGMAAAVGQELSIEECFRYATAVAAADALTDVAGYVQPEDVRRLLPLVSVNKVLTE